MQGNRDVISDRATGLVFVVVFTTRFHRVQCVRNAHEPVQVQALRPNFAVEYLNKPFSVSLSEFEKSEHVSQFHAGSLR